MTREQAPLNGRQDIAAAKVGTAQGASGLERLLRSLDQGANHGPGALPRRGLPPVERWNPPFCGEIDMRIAADGQWFYMGTPIGRPKLVSLFASVLVREGDDYRLVTPVEKVGIRVDDAPFQAVEMAADGEGLTLALSFRTNVDDVVSVGPGHGLRFERDARGGLCPYVHVRRNLWARVTRALTYDLLALGGVEQHGELAMFGVRAGGLFWPAVPASEVEDLA
jgi:hypothetical protein